MEEIGIVKYVRGDKAFISVQKQSACDSCAAGGSCKAGADGAEVEAINQAAAHVGDRVKVIFTPYTYVKGTLIFYGIPAVCLVLGAVIGKDVLSRFLPGSDPDTLSGLAGIGLFLVSFFVVRLIMRAFEKKRELIPVVAEVLGAEKMHPM